MYLHTLILYSLSVYGYEGMSDDDCVIESSAPQKFQLEIPRDIMPHGVEVCIKWVLPAVQDLQTNMYKIALSLKAHGAHHGIFSQAPFCLACGGQPCIRLHCTRVIDWEFT